MNAAQEALNGLGYGHIGHYRSVDCSLKELFIAQLVRASMMQYAKIIIIRPFVMLKDTEDIHMILESLGALKEQCDCMILDMKANRAKYEAGGELCRIIG
ncbi:MAG: hypothetical protein R3302_02415 [Sulfurimonadaceae bacterium]|nr:hypothetical protein [Sulfurimonadaceae bacterium]